MNDFKEIPVVNYRPGDIIFREGDKADAVYLINEGLVEISTSSSKGRNVLSRLGPFHIFGEMAIIDGRTRSATVSAVNDTECRVCKADALKHQITLLPGYVHEAFQELSATIRSHNHSYTQEDLKNPRLLVRRKEIANNPSIKGYLEHANPFMKALFRILLNTAYPNK
ncbi:cyclic nucleotide-binding domain-containing protein [Rickettsiales bacterium]|nr:cyclic nucleotide-binding domain-containing protein [Rickettsiales bacterium]